MHYPVYRKYANEASFFKIIDAQHFLEVKKTAKHWELHQFEAKIHPDRLFIQDMIDMHNGHWLLSTEGEFNKVLGEIDSQGK